MQHLRYLLLFGALALLIAGCGTRSSSSVEPVTGATPATAALSTKPTSSVVVTENDITDRPYTALGDISVTVSKNTIFDKDPTKAMVADALRKKAAEMGADAVVLTRYGTVGIGFFSWGEMEGKGRAVVFKQ
jgi:uncharacterized protein YbjQ (UPF0145 family)